MQYSLLPSSSYWSCWSLSFWSAPSQNIPTLPVSRQPQKPSVNVLTSRAKWQPMATSVWEDGRLQVGLKMFLIFDLIWCLLMSFGFGWNSRHMAPHQWRAFPELNSNQTSFTMRDSNTVTSKSNNNYQTVSNIRWECNRWTSDIASAMCYILQYILSMLVSGWFTFTIRWCISKQLVGGE